MAEGLTVALGEAAATLSALERRVALPTMEMILEDMLCVYYLEKS